MTDKPRSIGKFGEPWTHKELDFVRDNTGRVMYEWDDITARVDRMVLCTNEMASVDDPAEWMNWVRGLLDAIGSNGSIDKTSIDKTMAYANEHYGELLRRLADS